MDNPGEILRLCRLCLVKDQVNIPIFEEQGDIRQIFLKISSCLPVTVSRDDQLPKKICDGCSNKLDLLYEFWNTSANAEKTLLSWLGQAGVKDADETISAVAQQIKPAETQVKEEALEDGHAISQDNFGLQSFDEDTKDEAEPPPRKRARRTAAVKAQISIAPESDDDDDDMDNTEAMTKVEGESEESDGEDRDPSYGEVPGTSADDQAGPSGVGKDGVEAPNNVLKIDGKMVKWMAICKLCNKIVHRENMQNHMSLHKKKEKQRVLCSHCGKSLAGTRSLYRHKQEVHFNKGKRYCCAICGQDFSSMKSCDIHKKSVHSQAKNHTFCCEKCGKRFMLDAQLKRHLKSHNELPRVPSIKCTVNGCLKVFRTTPSLKYHLHSHQDTKPTLTCSFCPKVFLSHPNNLKRHERRHTSAPRFSCHICNKVVTTLSSLQVHIRTHTGEKPFICEACGKEFISLTLLKTHSVVHTKERKHICRVCNSSFTQRGPLKAHFQNKHPSENL